MGLVAMMAGNLVSLDSLILKAMMLILKNNTKNLLFISKVYMIIIQSMVRGLTIRTLTMVFFLSLIHLK